MADIEARRCQISETLHELCFSLRYLRSYIIWSRARPADKAYSRHRKMKFQMLQFLASHVKEQLLKTEYYDIFSMNSLLERSSWLELVTGKQPQAIQPLVAMLTDSSDKLQQLELRIEELIARVRVPRKQTASLRGRQRRRCDKQLQLQQARAFWFAVQDCGHAANSHLPPMLRSRSCRDATVSPSWLENCSMLGEAYRVVFSSEHTHTDPLIFIPGQIGGKSCCWILEHR